MIFKGYAIILTTNYSSYKIKLKLTSQSTFLKAF